MEINKSIQRILKENNIDVQGGTLVLLGIFYGLDVEKVCPEEIVRAINITKIVEKDYSSNTIRWNMALFVGQEIEWEWVSSKYNAMWKGYPDRQDNNSDVLKRMQKFFSVYPQYRKQDIATATIAYFRTVKDPQYLKSSAKFIFEGVGAMQKSMLLTWCEKTAGKESETYLKGKIVR